MPWITLENCERLTEWARTIKQSQVNSSNKFTSYLLVQSCRSAVLKFLKLNNQHKLTKFMTITVLYGSEKADNVTLNPRENCHSLPMP